MGKVPEKLGIQYRTVTIERDALETRADNDPSIPVAISSETPVDRHFGREVLSHEQGSIDLTYARDGLPFLMNHDTGVQLGVVRGIKVGSDKVLRGRVLFGNHPDAEWVRLDMEQGIRQNISVGYRVNSMILSGSDSERGDEYTVDSWTPMEVSTVPVPADITVGVGREASDGALPVRVGAIGHTPAQPAEEGKMSESVTPAAEPGRVAARSTEDIRTEIANIYALGAEHGCMDEAARAVERGISRDRFASEILERKIKEAKATATVGVDLSEKEHRSYSVARAIAAQHIRDYKDAGLEREVSKTLAQMSGVQGENRLFIPWNTRTAVTGQFVSTSSLGGAGVATEMRELIDLLRNRLVVAEAGATFMAGLTGNISYPRQLTATTLAWTGENPSTGNANSAMTFDNVTLSPKTAMVSTAFSRQLLVQSSFDASVAVNNDLSRVVAIGVDYAALNGVGSSNQPTGLRVQSGITNKTLGAAGANLAWADIVSVETSIATANADIGSISWIVTPGTRGKLKTTLFNTTSGAGYIWGPDDRLNGYRALVSNQLPSNLTKSTSTTICHSAVFGVFSELLVGFWGPGLELIVDPYSVASQNMVQVHALVMADVAIKHPASFAKIDDILVT